MFVNIVDVCEYRRYPMYGFCLIALGSKSTEIYGKINKDDKFLK